MNVRDSEICTHAFEDHEAHHGAMIPPIYQTSLFTFPDLAAFTRSLASEREHFVYSRGLNPTVKVLEDKLAALERGEHCKAFGSGMGAISATLLALLKQGDHVLLVNQTYGPTVQLLEHLRDYGIDYHTTSGELDEIERQIRPETRLIYIESPSSMLMQISDLEGIARLAKARGITTAIDNTWATPLFQKPLTLGIDLSIHTLSKYLGGHSDVVGGAVVGSTAMVDRIFERGHQLLGSVLSPHNAFLVMRGLRTLPLRMRQHQANVLKIIDYLQQQPEIITINHPSQLTGHARHLSQRQLSGYAGLLSIELADTDYACMARFIDSLRIFKIGVSWGGYESLAMSPLQPDDSGPPLIRLAIGLEDNELLLEDLQRGFAAIRA